jgi:hypothetical protein
VNSRQFLRNSPTRNGELRLESTAANSPTSDFREAEANLPILVIKTFIQSFCSWEAKFGAIFWTSSAEGSAVPTYAFYCELQ